MPSTTTTTILPGQLHGGAATSSVTAEIPSPPPPTPSNHPLPSNTADSALSRFLHQLTLPPKLNPLPSSRSKPQTLTPPLISLQSPDRDLLHSAASQLGLFHLSDHNIHSELHESAQLQESHLEPLSDLSILGIDDEPDDGDHVHVFDTDGGDGTKGVLEVYARELRRVGLKVLELLFEEKVACEARCLMWVSSAANGGRGELENKMKKGKGYPYVLGLQYEQKGKKEPSWVVADSGEWVAVSAREETVLVTLGDIAQVWSNGRLKKVRSRPQPSLLTMEECGESGRMSPTLTLLITLPLDAMISPILLLELHIIRDDQQEQSYQNIDKKNDRRKFRDFSMEEYAWRVYHDHERLLFKDPLARYRL